MEQLHVDPFLNWSLATAGAAIVWFGVLGALFWRTKAGFVIPAEASQQLGQERPALAHLITNRWECGPGAAEATLVDLAARGYLTFERIGDQPEQAMCRVARPYDEGLTRYEELVMSRVRQVAVSGAVPLPGLAHGSPIENRLWSESFAKEVVAEARTQGLSKPRISPVLRAVLVATSIVPSILLGIAVMRLFNHPAGLLAGLPLLGLLVKASWWINGESDTGQGRQVAALWLGVREYLRAHPGFADLPPVAVTLWQRYLAYGCALGVATTTLHTLELGPGDDRYGWSAYAGSWRRIRIRYPKRPGWGQPLDRLASIGAIALAWAVLIGWLVGLNNTAGRPQLAILTWTSVAIAASGGIAILAAVAIDLVFPRAITGQVLHLREQTKRKWGAPKWLTTTRYFIVVDDGEDDTALGYVAPIKLFVETSKDDVVTMKVGRFFGWIRDLEKVHEGWQWRSMPGMGGIHQALSAGPSTPTADPLTVLSPEAIQSVMHAPVAVVPLTHRMFSFTDDVRSARYQLMNTSNATITVHIAAGTAGAQLLEHAKQAGSQISGQQKYPNPDVGDEAYSGGNEIVARRGSTVIYLQVAQQIGHPPTWALPGLAHVAVKSLGTRETVTYGG